MSEVLRERQKKELKELQAKIQAIKKAVPKGDKKAKKRSAEEIAQLQKDISDRHDKELAACTEPAAPDSSAQLQELKLSDEPTTKKPSKAEKRREAKAAAEQRKLEDISTLELDTTARAQEHAKLLELVSAQGLRIQDIPADGNCMFYALQHQLEQRGVKESVQALRDTAACFMMEHETDFLPYLVHPSTGDMLTSAQFSTYCNDIRTNGVWGGMHEAHAISTALKVPIQILQADSPPVLLGEKYDTQPIVLLYYKHKFGLGEHYDSVTQVC